MYFEIDSKATPVSNITINDYEYPTAGVEGTVLAMQPEAVIDGMDPADYAYLLLFESALNPLTVTGTEDVSIQQAWFSGETLGIVPSGIPEYVSVGNAAMALGNATSTTSTAANVTTNLTASLPKTATRAATVKFLTAHIQNIDSVIQSTTITGEGFAQQESAGEVNIAVTYTANDAVLLQEAVENIAQQEAVIAERLNTLTAIKQQIRTASEQAYLQDVQDEIAYAEAFSTDPTTTQTSQSTTTEDWLRQQLINNPLLNIEEELEKLKLS